MSASLLTELSIGDNAQPLEGTYTAASGSNRLVVVLSTANVGTQVTLTMGTCTFGGVAFTQAAVENELSGSGATVALYIGYIKEADIPSGSQTVSVSWAEGDYGNDLWILTLADVNQTTPVRATDGDVAIDVASLASLSLAGLEVGDFVVALAGQSTTVESITAPAGYTSFTVATNTHPSGSSGAAYKAVGSSGTEVLTFGGYGAGKVGQIAVAFAAAGAGAATLTDVDTDETIVPGQTGVVATGTNLSTGASARWVDANGNVLTMVNYSAHATAPTFDVPNLATTLAAGVKFGSGDFEIWSA